MEINIPYETDARYDCLMTICDKTVLRCGAARFGLSITPLQELTVETKLRSEGVMNGHYDDNDLRELRRR